VPQAPPGFYPERHTGDLHGFYSAVMTHPTHPTTPSWPKPAAQARPAPTRRLWLLTAPALALGAWALSPRRAQAQMAASLLEESDPGAQGLAYRANVAQVDPAKNPSYKPGQTCANCSLYTGDVGQSQGGCALFYGKEVAAAGWCNAWERKAG